ncbi:phenylalanine--tRNA ligase subunit beta [Candidatus Bodocaedibacter vickermanii]|uniref:Phenylalanine--tRNA ligase beta subunit n=1 Tax=Candidatus Bodocaedibacter vickermanii TaxID=2741701 RepID=A0A7L9RUS6_9PROT|nr:Phenylalanine--tRNA ligase beta subunit [Candidatus Paracaedibacteraceae bacterium 'Lake Konstanz']
MKFTLSWLYEHLHTKKALADLMHHLTMLGIEVESYDDPTPRLAPFLIAQIKSLEKHPNADRLNVCNVQISADESEPLVQVVCGAPNVYAGMKTVFAHIGTHIPGLDITLKAGNIRGVASNGMLCSLNELSLGQDQDGIVDLPKDAPVGRPFAKTFGHDDPTIEVSITPNRADCFGVVGIARDIAAAGFGEYIHKKIPVINGVYPCSKTVRIESKDDCPVYMGRTIRNVKNTQSPEWLQQRLRKIGLEPISAIVDITNYVCYDLCRPLHAFDADTIGSNIIVRNAVSGETFQGLNDKDYALTDRHLVIADEQNVLALAGVLGGKASGTTLDTTTVFLESALFHPTVVSTTGRELNIHTDSRVRFERGVDPESVRFGLDIATQMIVDICGGEPSDSIMAGTVPTNLNEIRLELARVKLLTGLSIPTKVIETYLTGLGFTNIQVVPGEALKVTTPSWRFDISNEHDVIEEIIRIHGYDNLPNTQLEMAPGFKPHSFAQSIPLKAKKILATLGLNESIHYSFVSEKIAIQFNEGNPTIELMNPISQQLSHMRPSVLPSLLETIQRNQAYQHKNLRIFEVGAVYHNATKPIQETVAAAILTGDSGAVDWRKHQRTYDVFDIKAIAFQLMERLGLKIETVQIDSEGAPSWYHPGQSAALKLGPKLVLGYFGRIHPTTEKSFECDQPIFGCEIFLDRLPLKPTKHTAYRPNLLQAVERDFAMIMDSDVPAAKLIKAAEGADKEYIQTVRLFDVYVGKGVPEGKKSMAFSVTFVPKDTTFNDEQIQQLSQKVIASVTKATGGELRGASA